ncbi:MAG: glycosyltransferase [Lachnospiraceae bacterium]
MPEIDIVIPVYNVEKYLEHCLDSIFSQSFQNFRIIAVNDGSTDQSGKILEDYVKKYPGKIEVITKENGGQSSARNRGLEASTSPYLMFLDSDDHLKQNMVEKLYEAIKKVDADMAICEFSYVSENGEVIRKSHQQLKENEVMNLKTMPSLLLADPAPWNKIYKRSLFIENNMRYPEGVWYEDLRCTTKLYAVASKVVYIKDNLYDYIVHTNSVMNNRNWQRQRDILDALKEIIQFYKERGMMNRVKDELEFLTLFHVYVLASTRLVIMNKKTEIIKEFRQFLIANFPNYKKNKYLDRMRKQDQLIYRLLNIHGEFLLVLLFKFKRFIQRSGR